MDEIKLEQYSVEQVNLPVHDDPQLVDVEEHLFALIDALHLKRQGTNPSAAPRKDDNGDDEENVEYKPSPSHGDKGGDDGNDVDDTQPLFDGV